MPMIPEREAELTAPHCLRERPLKEPLAGLGIEAVQRIFRFLRIKDAHMICKADHRVRIAQLFARFMENFISSDMAISHVFHHTEGLRVGFPSRRPRAEAVTVRGINIRLVNRDPVVHEVSEAVGAHTDEVQKILQIFPLFKRALFLEPHGVGKMVQRHKRTDAEVAQIAQLLTVMPHGLHRDLAAFWHEARPLQSEAADVQPHRGHQVTVLAPAIPMVVCNRRVGAVLDVPLMIPIVPVAADLAALDLR